MWWRPARSPSRPLPFRSPTSSARPRRWRRIWRCPPPRRAVHHPGADRWLAGTWLTVTPASGNTPATLVVSVSPTTLAAGNYTGRIVITSPNALTPVTVPVTLAVSAIPKPVVVAIKNAANYFSGNVSPGENIVIGGTGLGPATLGQRRHRQQRLHHHRRQHPRPLRRCRGAHHLRLRHPDQRHGALRRRGRTTTSIVVEYLRRPVRPRVTYNVAAAVPGIYTQNCSGHWSWRDPESERRHQ